MSVKVIFSVAGIDNANLDGWKRTYMRYNRLHVPLEGCAVYHDAKGDRILHEGNAYFLINSYSPNFETVQGYGYRHMYIDFRTTPPILSRDIIEINLSEDPFTAYLLKAVQCMVQENALLYQREVIYSQNKNGDEEQIKQLLKSLLIHMQRRYGLQTVDNPKIETALRYIDEHYAEQLHNEDIAAALHIDKRSLIRLFGRYMNMTPWQYLTQYRVEAAIEHLRNGKSVTETAFLCGYQSEVSLRQAFLRVLGCTPKAVLKQ